MRCVDCRRKATKTLRVGNVIWLLCERHCRDTQKALNRMMDYPDADLDEPEAGADLGVWVDPEPPKSA